MYDCAGTSKPMTRSQFRSSLRFCYCFGAVDLNCNGVIGFEVPAQSYIGTQCKVNDYYVLFICVLSVWLTIIYYYAKDLQNYQIINIIPHISNKIIHKVILPLRMSIYTATVERKRENSVCVDCTRALSHMGYNFRYCFIMCWCPGVHCIMGLGSWPGSLKIHTKRDTIIAKIK